MTIKRNQNSLYLYTPLLFVAAVWACVPEGPESSDELRDIDVEATEDQVTEPPAGPADDRAVEFAGQGPSERSGSHTSGAANNSLQADFDGDGRADLAVGVPYDNIDGVITGAVNVIYGTSHGLDEDDDQLWHRGSTGIGGDAMNYDLFGWALAAGDFNGDGYADLAIGAPTADLGGVVHVLYGTSHGLDDAGTQIWGQDSTDIEGIAESGDLFGVSLTTGDFDGDGFADLAIGVPYDVTTGIRSGSVNVIYGSSMGLTAVDNQLWSQDSSGLPGGGEDYDVFGDAVAGGDLDGDGRDDLAIGVPGKNIGMTFGAGQVNVLYGSATGITPVNNQVWHQDTPGIDGIAEDYDRFGDALAIGDFDNNGSGDLVIGVPYEDVGMLYDAGAINVIYGTSHGLDEDDDQFLHQNSPGIEGVAEAYDGFGFSLAVGNFDGDHEDDLAIGVPFEGLGDIFAAGMVNVLYGSHHHGLTGNDDQLWHQNIDGVRGVAEEWDLFGYSLSTGDFDGDGRTDLAIGVPAEDLGDIMDAGSVNVLYGKSSGLDEDDDQIWNQNSPGIDGVAEPYEYFGVAER